MYKCFFSARTHESLQRRPHSCETIPYGFLWTQPRGGKRAAISAQRQPADTFAEVAENYRSYFGTGSAHTMWGNDRVYLDGDPAPDPLEARFEESNGDTFIVSE